MSEQANKAYFNIDRGIFFEGYYIKGRTWNGWEMPYFEKEIADIMAEKFSTDDYKIVYDKYTDCYICKEFEDGKVIDSYIVERIEIDTENGKKNLYDFGTVGWIWDRYSKEELKQMNEKELISIEDINSIEEIDFDL